MSSSSKEADHVVNELWRNESVGGSVFGADGSGNAAGVHIEVKNLSYSVDLGKTTKHLLKNVSFCLEPGTLCALMGPSGAGKSTLLDLLANRKLSGNWSGDILFNHNHRSKFFNRDSAYVLQDDKHIAQLTVEETIRYSAWVRLPEGTSVEFREKRVTALLEMIGLSHVKDSIVGDAMHKGISGGQLKRLSIAVEIVAMPNLIFLDEPTSGLDSSIALEVMSAVQRLSHQNRTCISTIHQPSPEVFALFDCVILLADGILVYGGSTNHVTDYFSTFGYKLEFNYNPAEFIIDIADGVLRTTSDTRLTSLQLAEAYEKSQYKVDLLKHQADNLTLTKQDRVKAHNAQTSSYTRLHATSKYTQFHMLLVRSWIATMRDPEEQLAQLGKNFFVGWLIGIVFYGQAHAEEPLFSIGGIPNPDVTNVSSLLFFAMMYTLMSNIQAIPFLCSRNTIYRRELIANAYSAAPYWLAQCLIVLPILLWNQALFFTISYFMCNFRSNSSYAMYFFWITYLTNLSSYYMAMLLAASFSDEKFSFVIFPMIFLFLSTFAGYSIELSDIPPLWQWAPVINYARYTFEGLMVNQWDYYTTDDNTFTIRGNGNVLALYDFEDYNKMDTIWILLLNIVIITILCYIAMRPLNNKLNAVPDALTCPSAGAPSSVGGSSSVTLSLPTTLKQSLLTEVEQARDKQDPNFAQQSLDVNWYRQNTGDLPHTKGCRLVFRQLFYSVPAKKKTTLTLLKGVTGRAGPGDMVALMGASGAGKSTLLDVLAGRKTTGEIKGDILFNGGPRTNKIMRSSAYVMQDNVHIGLLTVEQSLYFAAELRLSETLSKDVKMNRVRKILNMLGLTAVKDTIVGDETHRGISGGQLKRLSIGVEIINLPDLIFLDEPTTGLDSAISHEVMSAVRNLANQQRTIICTIHQPSPATYLLFDKLLLMAEGRVIYFGNAREVVPFFTESPYKFSYKEGSNPADFVIAVAGGFLNSCTGIKISGGELAAYYSASHLCSHFNETLDSQIAADAEVSTPHGAIVDPLAKNDDVSNWNTSTLHQIKVLTHRAVLKVIRNYPVTIGTFLRHLLIGMFYGSLYWHLSTGYDPTCYQNRLCLFFFSLMFVLVGHQQVIPEMQDERLLFYRERSAKAYGAFSYLTAELLVLIPLNVINIFVYCVTLYYMAELTNDHNAFGFFYFILLIVNFIGLFQCWIVSNLASTTQAAMSYFPIALFFSVAFAGFIVYIPQFPDWLSWGPDVTFMRYAFQALTLNEFVDNSDLPDENYYINNLGFNDLSKEDCVPILLAFLGAYWLLSLITLRFINWEQR